MTGTVQGCLLDNLLKTRYPLTYYLIRQQEFVKVFSSLTTNTSPIPSEVQTSIIPKRKVSPAVWHNISDTKVPQTSKLNNRRSGFNSDQDYYSTQDQSSEIDDDDDTEEYDARPLLKNIHQKRHVKR